MATFNFNDIRLAVAKHFEAQNKKPVLLRLDLEDGQRLFNQPFNMVTYDSNGNTDGILVIHYAEFLAETKENNLPLSSGLAVQNTWVCLSSSMLESCLPNLDEFTGILLWDRIYDREYKITEYRKADRMHEYPFPPETVKELEKIQDANIQHEERKRRMMSLHPKLFGKE